MEAAHSAPLSAKMNVIAFVNPGSGGNQGGVVMSILCDLLGADSVFDIKADRGPVRGLSLRASDPNVEIRALVAGGDGTFSWVANEVDQQHLSHVRLVVIPLGSGNDMSRALGWGKKYPGAGRIAEYVEWTRKAPSQKLDVWRLDAVEDPAAHGVSGNVDVDGINHGARPLVCNYLSLGADALVELRFNQLRWESPDKYTSRLGNFKAHLVVGTKYMVSSEKIRVCDHVESLIVDSNPVPIPTNLQALIFLNIPSYGAGTQPWGFPRGGNKCDRMLVNDHKFEVIGLKSLQHFGLIKSLSVHGVRITQGTSMELKLRSPSTPFQVDGEPWEQRGGYVTLTPGNSVGVLQGPKFSTRSRKNAKFGSLENSATDDLRVGSPHADKRISGSNPSPELQLSRPTASFG
jgi:diacylglycerol kinase (ATP)